MLDLPTAHAGKMRREWGLQNIVGTSAPASPLTQRNDFRLQRVRGKIAQFTQTAIYPQQLTVPRQYATTREGCWIYKILEGREIAGFREDGVRVVVQENAQQARFVMSPLFTAKQDALSWAIKEMGAEPL
jgi:hypothetical protein